MTFEKFLSAPVPRTDIFSLSVQNMFFSTMSVFSHDLAERKETLAACAKGHFQRLACAVSSHFLHHQEMVTLRKRKVESLSPRSTTSSGRSKRRVLTKPARLDFGLLSATSPRRQIRQFGRKEGSKRVTTVIEPGGKNMVRLEQPRFAQGAVKRARQM